MKSFQRQDTDHEARKRKDYWSSKEGGDMKLHSFSARGLTFRAIISVVSFLLLSTLIQGQNHFGSTSSQKKVKFAYIADSGDHLSGNTVSVVNTSTNTVVGAILVGQAPGGVAITPDGSYAYVTSSNRVSVIDTAKNIVRKTIAVASPGAVAITPDGSYAYVTCCVPTTYDDGGVAVISTAKYKIVTTIGNIAGANEVAITPDGTKAVVTQGAGPDSVTVISTATNAVVASIPLQDQTFGVAITPDSHFAYVTLWHLSLVDIIDLTTYTVVDSVQVGSFPISVSMRPDGAYAYVVDTALFGGSPDVEVIDTATHSMVATIPMGNDPQQLAFIPNTNLAYVTNQLWNAVVVIDIGTNTVVSTFNAGSGPVGVAVQP
jgi:YVTN family beta-propeller protein